MSLKFRIGGRDVVLSKEAVEAALRGEEPERIKKYFVQINGKHFPIKQVIAKSTKVPTALFISTDAYRILTRLGFEVRE